MPIREPPFDFSNRGSSSALPVRFLKLRLVFLAQPIDFRTDESGAGIVWIFVMRLVRNWHTRLSVIINVRLKAQFQFTGTVDSEFQFAPMVQRDVFILVMIL